MSEGTSLRGKVALITGGSRGIGAAVARRFAAAGMCVAIGYQARGDAAASLAAEITQGGGQCMTVQGDIADGEAVQRIATDTAWWAPAVMIESVCALLPFALGSARIWLRSASVFAI